MTEPLFDCISVNFESYAVTVIMATGKTRRNAEAISEMAAIRRGCDTEFYPVVATGRFKVGESYTNKKLYDQTPNQKRGAVGAHNRHC